MLNQMANAGLSSGILPAIKGTMDEPMNRQAVHASMEEAVNRHYKELKKIEE